MVYLCDHGKNPEPSRAKEPVPDANGKKRKQRAYRTFKVNCKARRTVNVMSDDTVRVRIKGRHTNHGQSGPFE